MGFTPHIGMLQAEESEIEERLKGLQHEVDAANSTLTRLRNLSFHQYVCFTLLSRQIPFYLLHPTIFQLEGRRKCLIGKHKRGIK